jgi:hypothetical protein
MRETPILVGSLVVAVSSPPVGVAVEMWEPAYGAGFQARWDGKQSSAKLPLLVPPRVISTANSEFRLFSCDCRRWRSHKAKMCVSSARYPTNASGGAAL